MKTLTKLLAAACTMALVLSAALDQAQARKGGERQGHDDRNRKAPPNKVVRDHTKPGCTGSGGACVTPGSSGKPTPTDRLHQERLPQRQRARSPKTLSWLSSSLSSSILSSWDVEAAAGRSCAEAQAERRAATAISRDNRGAQRKAVGRPNRFTTVQGAEVLPGDGVWATLGITARSS